MSKQKTIKKSCSFREDIYEYAKEQADKFYSGNLSGYLANLISESMHGVVRVSEIRGDRLEEKDEVTEKEDKEIKFEKNEETKEMIDDVMEDWM